jgi:LmbE family N-acetylglucosaminyl deacetylase
MRAFVASLLLLLPGLAGAAGPREAVIVVSPHPDDESILAAGTLHRLAPDRALLLRAIYMSGGDRATVPGPCNGIPEARKRRRIVKLRERETRAAWKVIAPGRRVPIRFLRGPDQGFVESSTWVDGVRADVFTPVGERLVARAARIAPRLPRSIERVRLFTAARYDAHGDHRAAYQAARRAGEALRARALEVRIWSFVIHDEVAADVPYCCVGDFHWPGDGPTHDRGLLVETASRPRPPAWPIALDVSDLGSIRHDAVSAHVSQTVGEPRLCMPVYLPFFYVRWWEKTVEPFYEEVL